MTGRLVIEKKRRLLGKTRKERLEIPIDSTDVAVHLKEGKSNPLDLLWIVTLLVTILAMW